MTDHENGFPPEPVPAALLPTGDRPSLAAAPVGVEGVPYLGFHLGRDLFGVPLQRLREVARLGRVRRIPGAPPGVAGLVNLRGEIVCALDTRTILGLDAWRASETAALIALRGFTYPVGIIVDSIAEIVSVDPERIDPLPVEWPSERAACFLGTTRVRLGFIGLLDLDRVVAE